MSDLQIAVRELRSLLEYGEIRDLAIRHELDLRRAYNLLQARIKITDADDAFIMACYDIAIRRKINRVDKIKHLAA